MSDSARSSITLSCSNSRNKTNDLKQSVIKKFFINVEAKEPNSWHGKCSVCSQGVADKYGTTSNFVPHMKTKHENIYEEWLDKKNVNLDTKQHLIIEYGVPLSIVDQNGFKSFMEVVDPMFLLISRRQISRDKLPKLHNKMISKLKLLCNNAEYVSVTLDVWTDRRLRSYIGIKLKPHWKIKIWQRCPGVFIINRKI